MGNITYTGQVLKYVGTSDINVSSTVLSSVANVRQLYAAQNASSASFVLYNPAFPPFLQGFTTFKPGSTYQVYVRALSTLPLYEK